MNFMIDSTVQHVSYLRPMGVPGEAGAVEVVHPVGAKLHWEGPPAPFEHPLSSTCSKYQIRNIQRAMLKTSSSTILQEHLLRSEFSHEAGLSPVRRLAEGVPLELRRTHNRHLVLSKFAPVDEHRIITFPDGFPQEKSVTCRYSLQAADGSYLIHLA